MYWLKRNTISVWHDRISLIGMGVGKCVYSLSDKTEVNAGVPLLGMEGMNMWDVVVVVNE